MPDLLNTSLTGMLAFQRALAVTSNNIANANTPGYSRQVAEFTTRLGSGSGNLYVGGGTQISTIKRIYDAMLGEQLQASTTGHARFSTLSTLAGRIDTLLADPDTGLNTGLQSFFNAVQDLANDPASIPTRQALLGEANGLANRFQALDRRFDELDSEVNQRLSLAVDDINRLSSAIADVNDRIAATSAGGQAPNDLLDERDRLVMALSEQVSVSTAIQDDGTMSVFIGSGQSLVIGKQAQGLSIAGSEFDPTRVNVVYEGAAGSTPLDNALTGGAIGGLLEFRSRMLDPARQSLGQTAAAFVQSFNLQQNAGMDLRGNLGGDFFAIDPPTILTSGNNSGSGTVVAAIADLGAFSGADYVLEFDGAAYSLTRQDNGAVIPLSGAGTAADPFVGDGIAIEVGGAPAAGDRLLIRTGQDAAGSIQNLIREPLDIAMAAPTRSAASLANTGNATISAASASDPTDPALLTSAVIEFIDPTTYSINGAGAFAYTEGDPIIINGTTVTINGSPFAGDQFTIDANFGASGDNSNGLLLNGIQTTGLLDGGAISINENYGRLVAGVGGTTHQIQSSLDAQSVVLRNAEDAMLSNSAVNLDEEAAKLIQYQQAYQAVAQVVGVANVLFDALLNATSR
ncbi:MAG: flagellar hook-associated protein FlgK [Gammaproteobacteria bacterium]|nr:flagellar hook-associated protein FlgK [Gammaproteobacteria bacterium]